MTQIAAKLFSSNFLEFMRRKNVNVSSEILSGNNESICEMATHTRLNDKTAIKD